MKNHKKDIYTDIKRSNVHQRWRSMFIMIFLKEMRSVARFDWSDRLFQSLEPLYENFSGHLRSFSLVF